jgi:phosphoglycerate dehydrogenase-like enzyme
MSTVKVLLGWNPTAEELEVISSNWPANAEIVKLEGRSQNELEEKMKDVDVVVGGVSKTMLELGPSIRLIHTLSHGIDGLLQPEIRKAIVDRNITVAKANPATINISEFVMMCMIALSRRAFKMHEALAYAGDWSDTRKATRMEGGLGGELFGSALGIVGFGNIGKEVRNRARAFGMSIGVYDRLPVEVGVAPYDLAFAYTSDKLGEFLGRCDYVVVTMPLTDETRGLINAQRFGEMKDGSYLINISRGPLVDERALWDALRTGKLAGFASDVWCVEEKPRPWGYPIPYPIHQYNVIMTPHYCGATKESRIRAITNAGDNIERMIRNEPLVGVANLVDGF